MERRPKDQSSKSATIRLAFARSARQVNRSHLDSDCAWLESTADLTHPARTSASTAQTIASLEGNAEGKATLIAAEVAVLVADAGGAIDLQADENASLCRKPISMPSWRRTWCDDE